MYCKKKFIIIRVKIVLFYHLLEKGPRRRMFAFCISTEFKDNVTGYYPSPQPFPASMPALCPIFSLEIKAEEETTPAGILTGTDAKKHGRQEARTPRSTDGRSRRILRLPTVSSNAARRNGKSTIYFHTRCIKCLVAILLITPP